jgi:DNA-binding transcriptional LysR family regulator
MDGGFRVLDTAAVAEAIALGKGFASVPAIAIASSLESVLGAVLGVALTGGRVSA